MNVSKIFLSDSDFEFIFGLELARIVHTIGYLSGDTCSICGGGCCREIGCRFFSEKFSCCPIYEIRPRECRYHFCHEILNSISLDEKDRELLNKPIKDLLNSESSKVTQLFPLFPNFMLDIEGLTSLGIKDDVDSIMESFSKGQMEEKLAGILLKSTCLSTGR